MHHLTTQCKVCFFRETNPGYEEYSLLFVHLVVLPKQLQISRRFVLGVDEDRLLPFVLSLVLFYLSCSLRPSSFFKDHANQGEYNESARRDDSVELMHD